MAKARKKRRKKASKKGHGGAAVKAQLTSVIKTLHSVKSKV
jgi:hypothetical protein